MIFLEGGQGWPLRNRFLFLKRPISPFFTIVNGENAAGGKGITSLIANEFFQAGIDAITLGNHAFDKTEN